MWSEAADGLRVEVGGGQGYRAGQPLPDTFKVIASGGPLRYRLELTVALEAGRLVCNELTARRDTAGPPITNAGLRSPLQRVIRQAGVRYAGDVSIGPDGSVAVDFPSSQAARWADQVATAPGRRARRPKDRARLEQVAQAWHQFRGLENALQRAADSIYCSRSQFHRLLHDALDQGVLDSSEVPTRPNRQRSSEEQR